MSDIKKRLIDAHDNFPVIADNPKTLFLDAADAISNLEYRIRRLVMVYMVDDQDPDRESRADFIIKNLSL